MHFWGDGFNFDRLDDAGRFIAKAVKRKTGCTLVWKEKFGSLRFEVIIPSKRTQRICRALDKISFGYYLGYRLIEHRVTDKAWKVTLNECLRAIKIFPDMKDEILQDIAADEMLVGKELHEKYWS